MQFTAVELLKHLDADVQSLRLTELQEIRVKHLRNSIVKKLEPSAREMALLEAAGFEQFIARNGRTGAYVVPESKFVEDLTTELHRMLLSDWDGEVCRPYVTWQKAVEHGGVGGGQSRFIDHTDFLSKMFSDKISTTSFPLWDYYHNTCGRRWQQAYAFAMPAPVFVLGGALRSVPKDSTKNRVICIEPTLNMFYQQGVRVGLEKCLREQCRIDISTQQDLNRNLARIGSIADSLATIDLSDASDTISLQLCERILPREVFSILEAVRSPFFEVGDKLYVQHMMSTMGNAFTFPLMTLILTAACRVIAQWHSVRLNKTNFGVFGDDIVVPTQLAPSVLECLRHLGMAPNVGKSFVNGPFRESCGGDYYLGAPVRGIYIKRMSNDQDCFSAFNRLHGWCLRYGVHLAGTLRYLLGQAKLRPVPRHEDQSAGHIFPRRYLTCPKRDENGALYYRALQSIQSYRRVDNGRDNPFGALIGFLGGYVREQRIGLRSHSRKTKVVKRKTPSWDHAQDPDFLGQDFEFSWSLLLSDD